jgi:hypothetical protein
LAELRDLMTQAGIEKGVVDACDLRLTVLGAKPGPSVLLRPTDPKLVALVAADTGLAQFEYAPRDLSLHFTPWSGVKGLSVWASGEEPEAEWRITCEAPAFSVSLESLTNSDRPKREVFWEFAAGCVASKQ